MTQINKILIFACTLSFLIVFSIQAQCLIFKVADEFKGTTTKESTMVVCNQEVIYETKHAESSKWLENNIKVTVPFEDYREYYDNEKKTIIKHRILANGTKLISYHLQDTLAWILSDESRTILGYKCYKAILPAKEAREKNITGEIEGDVIVWYTPEIPVSAGIGRLHGLPGLILTIEYSDATAFVVRVISVEKTETTIQKPPEGIEVPRELIEKSSPSKKELKKYMEVKGK
jgi:GLPGLI family protein